VIVAVWISNRHPIMHFVKGNPKYVSLQTVQWF